MMGFSTIRRDRDGRGGGIMALVNDALLPQQPHQHDNKDIELVWLSITIKCSNSIQFNSTFISILVKIKGNFAKTE